MYLKRGRLADLRPPPSNPNATAECRLLYAKLQTQFGSRAGSQRPMFIGCNETAATVPYFTATGAHVERLTGKTPLLKAFWIGAPGSQGFNEAVAAIKAHHRAGGICAALWHPKNYLTGGNNYDREKGNWDAVLACKVGGSKITEYRADLDVLANTLNTVLLDDNGKRIPFIIRIFNEINGWFDFPDMTVDSLTRSGSTATMHFTRGANPLTAQWAAANCKFQIRGASDTKWNKIHDVVGYVADGDGNGGTVTFTVTDSPTSGPTGTILTYPLAGDWWAGADRAADVLELARQTIDYMRDTKGCNQLMWCCDLFTYNRLTSSTNPANNAYSIWLTGMESYWDIVTSNLYQDEPTSWGFFDFGATEVVASFQTLVDWCDANQRPIFYHEFGGRYSGVQDPVAWSQKMMGAFDSKTPYRRLAGVVTWTYPNFLPAVGTAVAADFAVAMDKSRYRWLGQ